MGHPQPPDRDEARRVTEVRGPLLGDRPPEVAETRMGYPEVEHQQRDCDGEHAVAERLDPPGGPAVLHGVLFHGAGRSPAVVTDGAASVSDIARDAGRVLVDRGRAFADFGQTPEGETASDWQQRASGE